MSAITLPRLIGTRHAADSIVDGASLGPDDEVVTIFARAVSSVAPSFADELVRQLRARGVRSLRVVGSPDLLFNYLSASASRVGDITVERSSSDGLVAN